MPKRHCAMINTIDSEEVGKMTYAGPSGFTADAKLKLDPFLPGFARDCIGAALALRARAAVAARAMKDFMFIERLIYVVSKGSIDQMSKSKKKERACNRCGGVK